MNWLSVLNGFVNIAVFAIPAGILVWADRPPVRDADEPSEPALAASGRRQGE